MIKNRLRNEDGMILAMVLMLMVLIAVLGALAINTSTVDVQIFGHQKRGSESFEWAQAGVDVSIPVIENTLIIGETPDFSDLPEIVLNSDVGDEVLGTTVSDDAVNYNPDVTVSEEVNGVPVERAKADIDRLYTQALAGGSLEFAGGYEGVGASAAGGGTSILFRIRSEGSR